MKECWQQKGILPPTPCFKRKGSLPCSPPDCLVEKAIQETGTTSLETIALMLHSRCRISSLSAPENEEFWARPDVPEENTR